MQIAIIIAASSSTTIFSCTEIFFSVSIFEHYLYIITGKDPAFNKKRDYLPKTFSQAIPFPVHLFFNQFENLYVSAIT